LLEGGAAMQTTVVSMFDQVPTVKFENDASQAYSS